MGQLAWVLSTELSGDCGSVFHRCCDHENRANKTENVAGSPGSRRPTCGDVVPERLETAAAGAVRHRQEDVAAVSEFKSRGGKPRTTCDQCEADCAASPTECVTVRLPKHWLYYETICIRCVTELGYTGCAYRQTPTGDLACEYVLGRAIPPANWNGRSVGAHELLRVLSSPGYAVPSAPIEIERLDLRWALEEFDWTDAGEAA
jgi:hypothetical protein